MHAPTPARPAPGGPVLRPTQAAGLAALLAATFAAFAGVRANGWVIVDDPIYVTQNPHVRGGLTWDNVLYFLRASHGGNWHPLTSWSHLLDVSVFGLSPVGPHLVNVALHALAAQLLVLVLHRLTGRFWSALVVAALFALHPLRVESVAWVSERKDVLSAVWFMLTLWCWTLWTEAPSARRYAATALALALGLASKPMLVTTPFVLLLLDAWPLARLKLEPVSLRDGTLAARLREKWPLFALALVFAVLTFAVQRATGAMSDTTVLPLGRRAANAAVSLWRYVGAWLWPARLGAFYPFPDAFSPGAVLGSLAALGLALGLSWRARRAAPWLLVGALWFVGMWLPVSGLVQVGRQGWADRYSYLPSIGLTIALVWSVAALVGRSRPARIAAAAAGVAVVLALALATRAQVARWRDSETLFAWTVRVAPRNPVALVGLGNARVQVRRLAEAIEPYRAALAVDPASVEARERLVIVLRQLGRDDEALQTALAGLRLNESARSWYDVGQIEAKLGRDSLAVKAFANSARLDGSQWGTHAAWAEALVRLGRAREAAARFDEALRLSPPNAPLLLQSAWLRATATDAAARDGARAVQQAERAIALAGGGLADAGNAATLAAAYAETGRFRDAVAAADSAVAAARALGLADAAAYLARQRAAYAAGRAWRE
ncbi:MAG: tetratricopeptide repeat protein [Candidatus Eisenbacteria bacterium]